MTFGDLPVCDYYGATDPKCVLAWGHNPAVSGPDGELLFHSRALTKTDTKFIVVDPRRTVLAEAAELWLQIRPGTDDALALDGSPDLHGNLLSGRRTLGTLQPSCRRSSETESTVGGVGRGRIDHRTPAAAARRPSAGVRRARPVP